VSYVVTARTLKGDAWTIGRRAKGEIERDGHECGIIVHW
jgi:hypothetical protein